MDYQHMKIEHIIEWCKENNEIAWLKETAAKQVECKVYPKVKGEDGKMHVDKTAAPKIEMRPISFIQLKLEFVRKFMPDIAPKTHEKKPTMYELIKAL